MGEPHAAEVVHDADGVGGLGDLGEGVAGVAHLVQAGEEAAERVFGEEEVAQVDLDDAVADEVEIGVETAVSEIGLVGVPADADGAIAGDVHDAADAGQGGGAGAVDLKPYLLSEVGRGLSKFAEGAPDLFEGLFLGDLFGETVGSNLDAGGADVVGELEVLFCGLDVCAETGGVGRVVVESGPEGIEFDGGTGEAAVDLGAFARGEVDLHPVHVGG